MIRINNSQEENQPEIVKINPVMKRHYELEIKTLQNAPRDADKLRRLLELKQRQKEEADHIEDTQRLVTEIEMLKVVLLFGEQKEAAAIIAAEKMTNKNRSSFFYS